MGPKSSSFDLFVSRSTTLYKLRIAMLYTLSAALVMSMCVFAAIGCGSGGTKSAAGNSTVPTGSGTETPASTVVSSASTVKGAPLTRTALIASANAICSRLRGHLLAVAKAQNTQQIFSRAATYEHKALVELQKLNPPAELSRDFAQILAGVNTMAEDSTKLIEDTKAKDMSAAEALSRSYDPVKREVVSIARRDGLSECARAF
jgi:hypothetical protein